MPKPSLHTLIWSEENQNYELYTSGCLQQKIGHEDKQLWQNWLAKQNSFSFQGQRGRILLSKEMRPRGKSYWYAYGPRGQRTTARKRYLGQATHLSLNNLEEVAAALAHEDDTTTSSILETAHQSRNTLPDLPINAITREHLLTQLKHNLIYPLTLLSAPAGSGKTTLMVQWLLTLKDRADTPSMAWITLESTHDDLYFFQRSIEIAQKTVCSLLILDNYQQITQPDIHAYITHLIDHAPSDFHLILISRTEPPLPLARWRAQGKMGGKLQSSDLGFSLQETQIFLQHRCAISLPEESCRYIQERTEGWIGGLQMFAIELCDRSPHELQPEHIRKLFIRSQQHITTYFIQEVLNQQPGSLQRFLLQTSILKRVTPQLCAAITEDADSPLYFEQLLRNNLFLQLLPDEESTYRYHPLFAEAMQYEIRQRLTETELHLLYQRACRWYEEYGFLADAIDTTFSAQQFERAANLMEQISSTPAFQNADAYRDFHGWLKRLPDEILYQHSGLCLTYIEILLFVVQQETIANRAVLNQLLQKTEEYAQGFQDTSTLGSLYTFRALIALRQGDNQLAWMLARNALVYLPKLEKRWSSICYSILESDEHEASIESPEKYLWQTLRDAEEYSIPGHLAIIRKSLLYQADTAQLRGELHQAEEHYRQVLQYAEEDLTDKAIALTGLAELFYEWNQLDHAAALAHTAFDLNQKLANHTSSVRTAFILARLNVARGEEEQARSLLQVLASQTLQWNAPHLYHIIQSYQIWLALTVQDMVAVERWAAARPTRDYVVANAQHLYEELLLAHLLILQDDIKQAISILDTCLKKAQQQQYTSWELRILILKLLAYHRGRQKKALRDTALRLLTLGRSEGYIRLFLDAGQEIAAALQFTLSDIHEAAQATYAHSLLRAFTLQNNSNEHTSQALLTPLSPQEQRVLHMLTDGYSTPEIARQLVVSVTTIRTQVQSIYRKLNVNKRVAACEAARRLLLV